MSGFTPLQIEAYRSYEQVRTSGFYNMYDPRARAATGLTGAEYSFVMKNFAALRGASVATTVNPKDKTCTCRD